jgi:hypothetical protein
VPISQSLIDRYSAGPTQNRIDAAVSLQRDVASALGSDYDVFLQGSYRNHTGVAELNDLDIVALSKSVHSTVGQGPAQYPVTWEEIFGRVERALGGHHRFRGLVKRGDKCVKVATQLNLDVVPAIYREDPTTDPIEVYSFREGSRRDNYPRQHWQRGADKNSGLRTDGAFKPTVRLFKYWARNFLSDPSIAPSFYIECAVHQVPDSEFRSYLPLSFVYVGLYLLQKVSRATWVWSVAGDKDILVPEEWHPDRFEQFQKELRDSVIDAGDAVQASTTAEADRLWRRAFGG